MEDQPTPVWQDHRKGRLSEHTETHIVGTFGNRVSLCPVMVSGRKTVIFADIRMIPFSAGANGGPSPASLQRCWNRW